MAVKYLQIARTLQTRIQSGEYPPDSLLPTEQQLCSCFGVSRQTIRQALQTLVDQGLIQRRQGSGSRVLGQTRDPLAQRTVAVITTYISNYIFPSILREVESVLFSSHCTMQLAATSNQVANERRILLGLLEKGVDGILVEGTKSALPNPNLDLYRQLQERGVPLVFFNGCYPGLEGCVSVLDDNFGGGRQLVHYLADKGHTRIAGIFKSDDMQGHQRYAGFAAGLRERNLPLEDAHLFWYATEDKPDMTSPNHFWVRRTTEVIRGCTAVVCYNDEVASALVQQLLRQQVKLPQEMAVVSFDNSHYTELSACRITSLSHGEENLGRIAAQELVNFFQGQPPASHVIPWTLEEKESS